MFTDLQPKIYQYLFFQSIRHPNKDFETNFHCHCIRYLKTTSAVSKQVLHNFKQRYRRGQRHYHKQWVGRTRNCFFELTTLLLEVKKLYKKTACGGEGVITFLVKVGLVDAEWSWRHVYRACVQLGSKIREYLRNSM